MRGADDGWGDYFYNACLAYGQEYGSDADAAALAVYVYERDQITGTSGRPIAGEDREAFVAAFRQREFGEVEAPADEEAADAAAQPPSDGYLSREDGPVWPRAGEGAHPAKDKRRRRISAPVDEPRDEGDSAGEFAALTVDRYYLPGGSTRPSTTSPRSSIPR